MLPMKLVIITFCLLCSSSLIKCRRPRNARQIKISEGDNSITYYDLLRGRDGLPGRDGVVGEKGEAGMAGKPGLLGLPGSPGQHGLTGNPGLPGPTGSPGKHGLTGDLGLPGPTGSPGEHGLTGDPGLPGITGSPGKHGLTRDPGLPGPTGSPGSPGEHGLTGDAGLPGITGSPGEHGLTGDHGLPGPTGSPGSPGEHGLTGDAGPTGPTGSPGEHGLTGDAGPTGPVGPAGPVSPASGGVLYTRWGKSSCPAIAGTELLYTGRAGGTYYNVQGGGANYLCMPEDPEYDTSLQYRSGVQEFATLHGTEYHNPLQGDHIHNVPCAVCYVTTREVVLMIPAKATCPPSWIREYHGYLMTAYRSSYRKRFECVDKDQESLPGSAVQMNGAQFFHAEASCNGLPCPPYNDWQELNCVVCTK